MNRIAPRLIRWGTPAIIHVPVAAALWLLLMTLFKADYSLVVSGPLVLLLGIFGTLSALYYHVFRPVEIGPHISARAGGLATFWARYVAIFVAVAIAYRPSVAGTSSIAAPSFFYWAVIAFAPILATMTQALVPEAFWRVSEQWQGRMLVNAAFMLFLHVSLSLAMILAVIIFG